MIYQTYCLIALATLSFVAASNRGWGSQSGNSGRGRQPYNCENFCESLYHARRTNPLVTACTTAAKGGQGLCYQCGPKAPKATYTQRKPDACQVGTTRATCCPSNMPTCCEDNACTNLNENNHCGSCRIKCKGSNTCQNGKCKPPPPTCTPACAAGQVCLGGTCYTDCSLSPQCPSGKTCFEDPVTQVCYIACTIGGNECAANNLFCPHTLSGVLPRHCACHGTSSYCNPTTCCASTQTCDLNTFLCVAPGPSPPPPTCTPACTTGNVCVEGTCLIDCSTNAICPVDGVCFQDPLGLACFISCTVGGTECPLGQVCVPGLNGLLPRRCV